MLIPTLYALEFIVIFANVVLSTPIVNSNTICTQLFSYLYQCYLKHLCSQFCIDLFVCVYFNTYTQFHSVLISFNIIHVVSFIVSHFIRAKISEISSDTHQLQLQSNIQLV